MNRDDLLEACFSRPVDELPVPTQWFNYEDPDQQGHVLSVAGLGWRRVIVRNSVAAGVDITTATSTVQVAAIMNVCTDPDHRDQGYATLQILAALEAAASHELTDWAALFCGPPLVGFYEQFGFYKPAPDAHPDFMVANLHDLPWPTGSIKLGDAW